MDYSKKVTEVILTDGNYLFSSNDALGDRRRARTYMFISFVLLQHSTRRASRVYGIVATALAIYTNTGEMDRFACHVEFDRSLFG